MKAISLMIIGLILFSVPAVFGRQTETLKVKMSLAGTSNLHDWESKVNEVTIRAQLEEEADKVTAISAIEMRVKVKSIKSPKGKIMDNKTYAALKADKHPEITFRANKGQLMQSGKFVMKGTLTVAGVSQPSEITVVCLAKGNGEYEFTGSKELLLPDYKVEPPTAMFGAITTGEKVTIHFTATMKIKA